MDRERKWLLLLFLPFVVLAWRFWFLCDDAYITFRYSRNLVRGIGLRFNRFEDPIEGYSNFLWMILAAGPEALGLHPGAVMPWVSAGCGVVLLWRAWRLCIDGFGLGREASLAGLLLASAAPAMGVWATSGLETMSFALLYFLLFELAVVHRPAPGERDFLLSRRGLATSACAIALFLSRPEGFGWVMVIGAMALAARRLEGMRTRTAMQANAWIAVAVVGYLLYEVWRIWVFGDWVPNTARVKVGFTMERLTRGLMYDGLYYLTFPVHALMLLAAPFAMARRRVLGTAVVMLALAPPVWAALMGGDFFPMGRMLVPGLPFAGVLAACAYQALVREAWRRPARYLAAAAVIVSAAPSWDLHVVPYSVLQKLHFRLSDTEFMTETARWANLVGNTDKFILRGRAMAAYAAYGDSIISRAIGALGYYSNLQIYDQYGLVSREVALLPTEGGPLQNSPGHDKEVEADFFFHYHPDFLFARYVQGRNSAIHIDDSLNRWEVSEEMQKEYVPDFVEMNLKGERERGFLFVVRRRMPHENAEEVWLKFESRRKALHRELKTRALRSRSEPAIDERPRKKAPAAEKPTSDEGEPSVRAQREAPRDEGGPEGG